MEKGRRTNNNNNNTNNNNNSYVSPLLYSGKSDVRRPLIQFDERGVGNVSSSNNSNNSSNNSNSPNIHVHNLPNPNNSQTSNSMRQSPVPKKPQRKDTETILRELLSGNEFYMAQFKKDLPECGREFSVGITRLLNFLHGRSEEVEVDDANGSGSGSGGNNNEPLIDDSTDDNTHSDKNNHDHSIQPDSAYDLTIDIKFTCELKETDFIGKNDKNYRIQDVPIGITLFYNVLDILSKEGKVTDLSIRYVNHPSLEKVKKVKGFLYATHEVPMFKQIMFSAKKVYFMKHFIIEGNDDLDLIIDEVKNDVNVW